MLLWKGKLGAKTEIQTPRQMSRVSKTLNGLVHLRVKSLPVYYTSVTH